jgi:hypothetical protein
VFAGQRPALARNDPLDILGRNRQQTLRIAAAQCCEKFLHRLDILLCAHIFFPLCFRGYFSRNIALPSNLTPLSITVPS